MTISEIKVETVQAYIRADDEELETLNILLTASKAAVMSYTGLTVDQLDEHEDLTVAVMLLCADLYDNRQFSVEHNRINPAAKLIMDLYSTNLL